MRAFLTGGSGFIGTRLKSDLIALGYEVIAPSHAEMDIISQISVHRAIETAQPDVVFHCAALTSGDEEAMYRVNVDGLRNVMGASRSVQLSAVVIVGSNVEYGNAATPFFETTVPLPTSVYGCTKNEATQLALQDETVPVVVLRFSNVYGEGGHSFIERLASAVYAGTTVQISDTLVRDFVHVSDASRACVLAATHITACRGQILNIASGDVYTTRQIVQMFCDMKHMPLSTFVSNIPYVPKSDDQLSNVADSTKARARIHWKPLISLRDALATLAQ